MILIYDDTIEGLMTALYWSYHYKTHEICSMSSYEPKLLDVPEYMVTDTHLASKMMGRIRNRFGERTAEKILYAFLSDQGDVGKIIRVFLDYAVTVTGAIEDYSHDCVYPLLALSRAVERESHLVVGLLRFEHLKSDVYYAAFEPTYDILSVLTPHFEKRLSDQVWVIHDVKRGKAVFYDTHESWTAPLDKQMALALHENEEAFQNLWKKYYEHIGIKERRNPKLRMNFMPKKYWKHLTELKNTKS
ncbi:MULTISPECIES: TIGR03915 family putative DNA repair protein [unclassified Fusibacter]|uniref:TIGR03915 family putative DNA repair protein n=1 Tax=unclassified Fusibacter TaxID=2624464 RepID=UPI001013BEA1|nr:MULTISPECIES: TIGR03915 family putative DNA repair protein [unclassified Fusibacter]MCK8061448.1 TIGR03915 family putative DNA repair protein [Fusibacter sp. A2]NPE23635.1 DNA metabolism protein [Fusibacter sp. A1]RXV58908.1 DNA metabolism protein [Fusibacter sp. A1]